jgi:hypothetical protein
MGSPRFFGAGVCQAVEHRIEWLNRNIIGAELATGL